MDVGAFRRGWRFGTNLGGTHQHLKHERAAGPCRRFVDKHHVLGHVFRRSLVNAVWESLQAMTLEIPQLPGYTIRLSWDAVPGTALYQLCERSISHVSAADPTATVIAPDAQFVRESSTGVPERQHFFRAVTRTASQCAFPSNVVGKVQFWCAGGALPPRC